MDKLFTLLNSITGFKDKVAYRMFPKGAAPELPFIVYYSQGTNNAFSDNKTYHVIEDINVCLYSKEKDTASEAAIESAFNDAKIPWNKSEVYIDTEECYEITYEITLI